MRLKIALAPLWFWNSFSTLRQNETSAERRFICSINQCTDQLLRRRKEN